MIVSQENSAFSLIKNQEAKSQFLNLILSDKNEKISLSGEDCPEFEKCKVTDNQITLDFNLTSFFVEEKKDIFEVKLYIERSKSLAILVNELPANTFQLDELVQFCFNDKKFQIEFSLVEGDGKFCGHAFFSNRPSRSIKDQFQSFDWIVGLRTIKRSSNCRVRTKISFL